jgi:MFS family permease
MTSLDRRNDVSQEEAAVPGEVRRWRAFSLLAVAYFMTIVDLTIVNVALPTIGRKLHFPQSDQCRCLSSANFRELAAAGA